MVWAARSRAQPILLLADLPLRQINPTGKSLLIFRNRVKPRNQKYICFHLTQIRCISIMSRPSEGRAHVTDVGRDAVDAGGVLDEQCRRGRRSRVVLTPRCWRQVCDKKRRRRCQTSLVTGESAK